MGALSGLTLSGLMACRHPSKALLSLSAGKSLRWLLFPEERDRVNCRKIAVTLIIAQARRQSRNAELPRENHGQPSLSRRLFCGKQGDQNCADESEAGCGDQQSSAIAARMDGHECHHGGVSQVSPSGV